MAMENPHVSFTVGTPAVRVFFPFEPYATQKEYISKVVDALNGRYHAILESPTGTGKTLSLLCSTLAWLNDDRGGIKKSMIYYTSRTHMQLNQAANEMKRTAYARNPAVVIGSRGKMCLNKDVKSEHGDHLINRACRNAIARNACEYFTNYEQKLEVMNLQTVNDIEDLLKFGTSHKCCPYYANTSMKKSLQLRLEDSVIIFDEGHNLEGALKDSASGAFTLTCLEVIQESCLKLPAKLSEAINNEKHGLSRNGYDPQKRTSVRDEFSSKKQNGKPEKEAKVNPIEELVEKLTNEKLQQVNRCAQELKQQIKSNLKLDESCSIDRVFTIMKNSGVQYSTSDTISTTLESMASFWSIAGVMNPTVVARYVTAITNLGQFISLLFPGSCISVLRQQANEKKLSNFYGAHLKGIYEESAVLKQGRHKDSELCLWCLHPGIGLKRVIDANCITGPRSIIVTSGTLAPTHSLPREMDLEFKIIQEFMHVINENQLKMIIIGSSPKGYSLNSNYSNIYEQGPNKTVFKEKYAVELGETLIPLLKVLPFGTLIFFPSYGLLTKVKKVWDKMNISQRMNSVCSIYIEDTKQDKFLSAITAFKNNIDNKTSNAKAAFLGVCRGKLSEGTNFDGNHCRNVVLVGLPYPSMQDPKIQLTEKFHDMRGKFDSERFSGQGKIWYSQQMTRALNQTIGRVIRSKNDYGMVIFCDPRFTQTKYSLSKWAQSFCPRSSTPWDKVDGEVKEFYQNHGLAIAETATESCGAFEIGFASRTLVPLDSWSSFSESNSSQPSQKSHSESSHSNGINTNNITNRQAAIAAEYMVDKDTYARAKNRVKPVADPEPVKKQKTTAELFDLIFESSYKPPLTNNERPTQSTQSKSTQSDYSILNQFRDKNRPGYYKCCICLKQADNPHRTNCKCARVGCFHCLKVLKNKPCGKCGVFVEEKKYKQLLFQSASGKEKHPLMVVASRQ